MSKIRQHQFVAVILLIAILFSALFNVPVALADGETPTEPPVATEPQTESTPEPTAAAEGPSATPEPVQSPVPETVPSQEPVAPESTPVAGILADVPEDTNLVVLDGQGEPLALGTLETAEAVVQSDPVWCPEGQFPGGAGCSTNFATITDLLAEMRTNPGAFAANGTIFLEHSGNTTFSTPLILDDSPASLSSAFATLSSFNLTVRGGYNGGTGPGSVGGTQAVFNNEGYILIGSLANPWVGSVRLEDIEVRDASVATSITVYTSSGNITFDDVDVGEQTGDKYLVYLHSLTGDISVGNGSNFHGNDADLGNNESRGFYAQTGGSISVDGTDNSQYSFRDNEGTPPEDHNGATLIAPTVTLTNVISRANDGNGIYIQGASLVTLTNVTSSVNQEGSTGNSLSGILIQGTGSTIVNLHGGTFAKNGRYGIELFGGTFVVHSDPVCPTEGATANALGCFIVVPVTPTQPTPTEPTPTQPTATEPGPTQPTATEPSPTQPAPTEGTPVPPTESPTQPTAPASTGSGSGTGGGSATSSLGSGSSSPGNSAIPLIGGELVGLDCDSVFIAFGIKLTFMGLCDYQTIVNEVAEGDLPGDLPAGSSYVTGLDLAVLNNGQELQTLPAGAGVQLDFPIPAGEYAVLYWDEATGAWVEVSWPLDPADVADALGIDEGDGLYRLNPSLVSFLQILTTNKTGIFILVQK